MKAALVLVALVAAALFVTTRGADEPASEPPAASTLAVARLDGAGEVRLVSRGEPTLLWFWAPWCSVCGSEAPQVQALAEDVRVIAIGGRDKAENGPAFVERHGLTAPTVAFDEAMTVWTRYEIPAQPGAVLLDRDGVERGRWLGPFDPDEVRARAQAL